MDFNVSLNLQSVGIVHGKSMSKVAMVLAVNHNLERKDIVFVFNNKNSDILLCCYGETTGKALELNAERPPSYDR